MQYNSITMPGSCQLRLPLLLLNKNRSILIWACFLALKYGETKNLWHFVYLWEIQVNSQVFQPSYLFTPWSKLD